MNGRVHLVGCEACTPVGLTAVTSAAAIRAGVGRVGDHAFMVDELGHPLVSAVVARIDPALRGPQRLMALARGPLKRICERLSMRSESVLPVLVATPEHRPGWTPQDEQDLRSLLADEMSRHGCAAASVEVVAQGHAGALAAIDRACTLVATQVSDMSIVVGVDSYFDADTIDWLLAHERLMTPQTRSSFVPGEGAGALVVMAEARRRAARVPSLAVVRSVGLAHEPVTVFDDAESFGVGLTRAVAHAAGALRLPEEIVENIYLDINAERYRGEEWGFVVLRAGHAFVDPVRYIAPCSLWGDLGAASGALLTVLAIRAWARSYSQGPRAMVCAGSDSGLRAALVLEHSSSLP